MCARSSTTCAPGAGFTPGAQNSAAISGGLPGTPTTASARVPLFLSREHCRDFLQALQCLVVQRVLQKNLRLHDQIFQRLELPPFFAAGRWSRGSLSVRSVRRVAWRRRARFQEPAGDPLQLRVFHFASQDRKSTRLNSSHITISYAVFCLKKKTRAPSWSHSRTGASSVPMQSHLRP